MPKIGALKRAARNTFAVRDPCSSTKKNIAREALNFFGV